jgi:hypothetical protein
MEPLHDELLVIYANGLTNIKKTLFSHNKHLKGSKEMSHQSIGGKCC